MSYEFQLLIFRDFFYICMVKIIKYKIFKYNILPEKYFQYYNSPRVFTLFFPLGICVFLFIHTQTHVIS